jgi:hypothetical protein
MRRHRVPAEQIIDADVTKLINPRFTGNDVLDTGNGLYPYRILGNLFKNLASHPSRCARNREQQAFCPGAFGNLADLVGRMNPQTLDPLPLHRFIVIDQRNGQVVVTAEQIGQ